MAEIYKIYKYTRGSDFSVKIQVIDESSLVYHEVTIPKDTNKDIKQLFLEEAEIAVLKQIEEDSNIGGCGV